jgi:hypothetical protein
MASPSYDEVKEIVEFRLNQTHELLEEFEYDLQKCNPEEFYAFLLGDKIANKRVTVRDILGSEYLMLHVAVEISEFIKMGIEIGEKTVSGNPPERVYEAHLKAADYEMGYALLLEDYYWMKHRLGYLIKIIEGDEDLPEALKAAAIQIYNSFKPYKDY